VKTRLFDSKTGKTGGFTLKAGQKATAATPFSKPTLAAAGLLPTDAGAKER